MKTVIFTFTLLLTTATAQSGTARDEVAPQTPPPSILSYKEFAAADGTAYMAMSLEDFSKLLDYVRKLEESDRPRQTVCYKTSGK